MYIHYILITEILPKVHSQIITKAGLSFHGYISTNFDFESPTHSGIRGVSIYVSLKLSATAINFDSSGFKDQNKRIARKNNWKF